MTKNQTASFDFEIEDDDGIVPVFDFDGVLASNAEDRIYKLQESPEENEFLHAVSAQFGVCGDTYKGDERYLRHLVYQAAALRLGRGIDPGPLAQHAAALTERARPFFVVSARSGVAAVRRMLSFLESEAIVPQEVFCVGRTPKTHQLKKVLSQVAGRPVRFYEDSGHHVGYSKRIEGQLDVVHVTQIDARSMSEVEAQYLETMKNALKGMGATDALRWIVSRRAEKG